VRLRGAETILIDCGDLYFEQAGLSRREVQAARAIECNGLPCIRGLRTEDRRQSRAAHLHGKGLDRAIALRANSGNDGLARLCRRARGGGDQHFWCIGRGIGRDTQNEVLAGEVLAIARLCGDGEIANLAGAGCPVQVLGLCIVSGAFGKASEADGECGSLCCAVEINCANACCRTCPKLHWQAECLPHHNSVVGDLQLRWAVDVEHANLHGAYRGGNSVIGGEREGVRRVVGRGPFDAAQDRVVDDVLPGCPFEVAGVGIEADACRSGAVV
jgi:hypothetical protein